MRRIVRALSLFLLFIVPRTASGATFDDAVALYNREEYVQAVRLVQPLAEQGDPDAQYLLATAYANGKGVKQSWQSSAYWLLRAAKQGSVRAQVGIGALYAGGLGVPQDWMSAYFWTRLGEKAGDATATKNLRNMDGKLTRRDISEGEHLVATFVPTPESTGRPRATTPSPSDQSLGTAFFVSNRGHAITNAHVVKDCRQITARRSGWKGPVQLIHRDVKNDLALLSVKDAPARRAPLSLDPKLGDDIVVYGFPLPGMLSSGGNITTGNIAALSGTRDDSRLLQISAPVQPGNSGGHVLDRSGNVVGIVVSKLDALAVAAITEDIPQNINFAVKSSLIATYLKTHDIPYQAADSSRSGTLSTAELARRAQEMTFQVECQH